MKSYHCYGPADRDDWFAKIEAESKAAALAEMRRQLRAAGAGWFAIANAYVIEAS